MMQDTESMRMDAQQTLDELYLEGLLPFRLFAHKVELLGFDEYIIRFYDSRLNSLDLSMRGPEMFKVAFRTAILNRVARRDAHFQMAISA